MTATKDLTKLQADMDFLAGVECFYGEDGKADWPDGRKGCLICNGSGLNPIYNCLRLRTRGKGWRTLPAFRAHEAVGKLQLEYLVSITPGNDGHLVNTQNGWWAMPTHPLSKSMFSDTPEKALMAALCEVEGGKL